MASLLLVLPIPFFTTITAIPITSSYPDVVPGPGLPSLESLNLTSEELYSMTLSPGLLPSLLPFLSPFSPHRNH